MARLFLGTHDEQRRLALLDELASRVGADGQRGSSRNVMISKLADAYEIAPQEVENLMNEIMEISMNPIKILAKLGARNNYEAVQELENQVLKHSKYGDPDHSLQDWLAAGDYDGDETPESIAQEWDNGRE